jgi:hypothetical protein
MTHSLRQSSFLSRDRDAAGHRRGAQAHQSDWQFPRKGLGQYPQALHSHHLQNFSARSGSAPALREPAADKTIAGYRPMRGCTLAGARCAFNRPFKTYTSREGSASAPGHENDFPVK